MALAVNMRIQYFRDDIRHYLTAVGPYVLPLWQGERRPNGSISILYTHSGMNRITKRGLLSRAVTADYSKPIWRSWPRKRIIKEQCREINRNAYILNNRRTRDVRRR